MYTKQGNSDTSIEYVHNGDIRGAKIMEYIEQLQNGKSGICPFWVAVDVYAKFGIKEFEAMPYVMQHIKKVLREIA